jgi:hypothetical protein
MNTRLGLAEQLANSKAGAETQYTQNMVDADKYGVGLEQEKTNQLLQLYQMALESGGTADIKGMASMMPGLDLDNLTPEQIEAFEGASAEPAPEDKIAFGKNLLNFSSGQKIGNTTLGGLMGNNKYVYNFGSGNQYVTAEQALAKVKTIYNGKKYIGDRINVESNKNAEWRIGFNYAGKWYPTYNQAKAALEKDIPSR